MNNDNVKVILKRKIAGSLSSPLDFHINWLLIRQPYEETTEESIKKIIDIMGDGENRSHSVGVLNQKMNPEYLSAYGKNLEPIAPVFLFVGPLFSTTDNLPFITRVLRYAADLRKNVIKEEVPDQTEETIKEQETSQETAGVRFSDVKEPKPPWVLRE